MLPSTMTFSRSVSRRNRSNSESKASTQRSHSRVESSGYSVTPPSSYKGARSGGTEVDYPNVSTFRSSGITINVKSPSVKASRRLGEDSVTLPVYGDHDSVQGSLSLDSQAYPSESGRIVLSLEGIFEYISPMSATKAGPSQITPGKHCHVFYRDEAIIPLYTTSESGRSRPAFRSALNTIRRTTSTERLFKPSVPKVRSMDFNAGRRDRPDSSSSSSSGHSASSSATWTSVSSSTSTDKSFNFCFELPRSGQNGDELPLSFSSSNIVSAGVRGRVYAENADIKYRVRAVWEGLDMTGKQAEVEAPILFQPDVEFQSLDGLSVPAPESWSEIPLNAKGDVPILCAITMPQPATFPRRSSIPYYVVFTTTPRSRSLALEVMTDATIAVSLIRRVGFFKTGKMPRPILISEPSPPPMLARKDSTKKTHASGLAPSKSISDLRSLRKKLRGAMPPMPRLDTSVVLTTSSTSSLPSSPDSPPLPPTPPSASTAAAPASANGIKDKNNTHLQNLKRAVRSAPPVLSGFRFGGSFRAPPESPSSESPSSTTPTSSIWHPSNKPLPTIPRKNQEVDRTAHRDVIDIRPGGGRPMPPVETTNVTAIEQSGSGGKYRVTDSRTLHTDVSVGFPKRPKGRPSVGGSHPSLETVSNLPDGLYKGSIPLQKGWFPSMQWDGMTVEYSLQVSVIFNDTVFKGQVPVRIL